MNKISPYKYNVRTYVPVSTLRKWYFGIFFKEFICTDLHTSIKLFVVPRESTGF